MVMLWMYTCHLVTVVVGTKELDLSLLQNEMICYRPSIRPIQFMDTASDVTWPSKMPPEGAKVATAARIWDSRSRKQSS